MGLERVCAKGVVFWKGQLLPVPREHLTASPIARSGRFDEVENLSMDRSCGEMNVREGRSRGACCFFGAPPSARARDSSGVCAGRRILREPVSVVVRGLIPLHSTSLGLRIAKVRTFNGFGRASS